MAVKHILNPQDQPHVTISVRNTGVRSSYPIELSAAPPTEVYPIYATNRASGSGVQPTAMHNPRPPRPSYSEEQKFYIMFCRIMRDEKWEDIEARFTAYFGCPRSRGGLTSVYYRIRKDWGMREVLKTGPAYYPNDINGVKARAHRFSREFLLSIGYPVN